MNDASVDSNRIKTPTNKQTNKWQFPCLTDIV